MVHAHGPYAVGQAHVRERRPSRRRRALEARVGGDDEHLPHLLRLLLRDGHPGGDAHVRPPSRGVAPNLHQRRPPGKRRREVHALDLLEVVRQRAVLEVAVGARQVRAARLAARRARSQKHVAVPEHQAVQIRGEQLHALRHLRLHAVVLVVVGPPLAVPPASRRKPLRLRGEQRRRHVQSGVLVLLEHRLVRRERVFPYEFAAVPAADAQRGPGRAPRQQLRPRVQRVGVHVRHGRGVQRLRGGEIALVREHSLGKRVRLRASVARARVPRGARLERHHAEVAVRVPPRRLRVPVHRRGRQRRLGRQRRGERRGGGRRSRRRRRRRRGVKRRVRRGGGRRLRGRRGRRRGRFRTRRRHGDYEVDVVLRRRRRHGRERQKRDQRRGRERPPRHAGCRSTRAGTRPHPTRRGTGPAGTGSRLVIGHSNVHVRRVKARARASPRMPALLLVRSGRPTGRMPPTKGDNNGADARTTENPGDVPRGSRARELVPRRV